MNHHPTHRYLSQDLRIVLRSLGLLIPAVGIMAVASLVVCLAFRETYVLLPFGMTAAISLGVGACLYFPFRNAGSAKTRHAMITAACAWLFMSFLAALPFLFTARFAEGTVHATQTLLHFKDLNNGFFEAMSGWTTTGLSMTLHPEDLPQSLNWWRAFLQWVGGLGVIILMLSLVAGAGTPFRSLYFAEREEKTHPSVVSTARILWSIYTLFTFCLTLLLWSVGMPLWPALLHTMAGLATGGFAFTSQSIASYPRVGIELVVVLTMVVGSSNFAVHYQLLQGRWKMLWQDFQTRSLLIALSLWVVLLFLENLLTMSVATSARLSFFQAISGATTTGFQTTDIRPWSDAAKVVLTLAMFVGCASGSTGGGIKIIRAMTLLRGARWQLRRLTSPSAIIPFHLGRKILSPEEATQRMQGAALVTFLWAAFIGIGVLVLLHTVPKEFTLTDVLFEATSAQSNVGLSVGITGPTMNTWAKLMLAFNMWAGRVEIVPVLMLLRSLFLGAR